MTNSYCPEIPLLGIKTEGRFIAASAFVFAFALVAALLAFDYLTLHDLYPELAAGATLMGGGIGVVRGSNQWDRLQQPAATPPRSGVVR